jgi:hypothetical protein
MTPDKRQFLIKSIAVKSAELLECIQWSDTDCDLVHARIAANELSELTKQLLEELD